MCTPSLGERNVLVSNYKLEQSDLMVVPVCSLVLLWSFWTILKRLLKYYSVICLFQVMKHWETFQSYCTVRCHSKNAKSKPNDVTLSEFCPVSDPAAVSLRMLWPGQQLINIAKFSHSL